MSYTVTQGLGSKARIYEGLTPAEAIRRAEALMADGKKDIVITGPSGETSLHRLKAAHSGAPPD